VIAALGSMGVIDITTTGRRTGEPRRIEIVYHVIGGRLYLSGQPRANRRSWLANLDADRNLTLHLRKPSEQDVRARARVIDEEAERRLVLGPVARNWKRDDLDLMVDQSPLVEVSIAD
jgi:hypothetical protein